METIAIPTDSLGHTHRETISTRNNIAIINHFVLNALNYFIIATKTYLCLYVSILWSDLESSRICLGTKYRYLLLELVAMFTTRVVIFPVTLKSEIRPMKCLNISSLLQKNPNLNILCLVRSTGCPGFEVKVIIKVLVPSDIIAKI